ncbi:MAG TPA: glycosyl transferase family 2 [Chryseobacterium sp.]|nr:glycosyl transferase family 2 [Chryseobacterium sp.]
MPSKNKLSLFIQILKYSFVGLIGMVVDFSVTYLLRNILFFNSFFATSVGFIIAVFSNYLLNCKITFKFHKPTRLGYYIFFAVSLVGLVLNLIITYLVVTLNYNFYKGKVIAVGTVFIWNFTANKFITFRHKNHSKPNPDPIIKVATK